MLQVRGPVAAKALKKNHCLAHQGKEMKRLWWSELDERIVGELRVERRRVRIIAKGRFYSVN